MTKEHSQITEEHSQITEEHSQITEEHGQMTEEHGQMTKIIVNPAGRKGRPDCSAFLLILLPVLTAFICLCCGRMRIGASDVMRVLFNGAEVLQNDPGTFKVVRTIRLPRVLLAMLCGMGLSAAGCTFQALFSNPLATPDTVGTASGAAFGAALGILLGFGQNGIQLMAFCCGLAACLLTFICASGRNGRNSSLILSGIMIGSLFSALISLVKFTADQEAQLPSITYWLMGSLSSAGWNSLKAGSPVILISCGVLYLLRWRLDLLSLTEEELIATGTNVKLLRAASVFCATAAASAVISMCGQVGWTGLIVPHLSRLIAGKGHRKLLPLSLSIGASFMTVVDTLARSLTASDLPVSILTAIIGAPFFILLLRLPGTDRL